MEKFRYLILLIVFIGGIGIVYSEAHSKSYDMVFWYPGEAGSTAEAEPVLAAFFDYLNKKTKAEFSGKYFNTVSEGLKYIRTKKPDFAIVSWIALRENENSLPPFDILAKTLPLPDGRDRDEFVIVGKKPAEGDKWNPPPNISLISSIPMGVAFFKTDMAPDLTGNISINTTKIMLMALKKIAAGEDMNTVALLTPSEKYTLDNMKSSWTEELAVLHRCRPIPTAPLIYFGAMPQAADRLMKALLEMPNDKEGKDVLSELRLKGFQP